MSIIEVSSVHETHKHASLNDFCVSFLIQKGRVNVAFVRTEISRISYEERKGLHLKRHGYLAIREWVLIQNPGEEYQWYD